MSKEIQDEIDKAKLLLSMNILYAVPLKDFVLDNYDLFIKEFIGCLHELNIIAGMSVPSGQTYKFYFSYDLLIATEGYKANKIVSFLKNKPYSFEEIAFLLKPEKRVYEPSVRTTPRLE